MQRTYITWILGTYRYEETGEQNGFSYQVLASRCPSGEKASDSGEDKLPLGCLRTDTLSKVFKSRISILPLRPTAMN